MKSPDLRHRSWRVSSLAAFTLLLAACITTGPRNQAEFGSYGYITDFKDVTHAKCKYGPLTFGNIGITDGTVFKDLTCTWRSLDGSSRTESVDMQTLLATKVIKWDFTDVEVHRNQPLVMSPDVRVELRDRIFRITVRAMVQYYGEYLPDGARRIPYRTVTNTLIERTGE